MKTTVYIILAIFLSSCFKEVDINLPQPAPKLVIGGLIESGKPIEIMVSKTLPMEDTAFYIKQNAIVTLETENETVQLTRRDNYYYTSEIIASQNQSYTIHARVDGYPEVYSSDIVPPKAEFTIDNYTETASVDGEGFNYSSLTIVLNNIPEELCYYELRLYCRTEAFDNNDFYYSDLLSNDIIVRDEGIVNETYGKIGLLFSNKLITTPNRKLTFFFENDPNDELNKIRDVEVQLRCVSKNYFEYKKMLYLNIQNQSSDIWDGSGNPVDAFSNITNGYGIFAGFSQTNQFKQL